jgi:hypothetical protein
MTSALVQIAGQHVNLGASMPCGSTASSRGKFFLCGKHGRPVGSASRRPAGRPSTCYASKMTINLGRLFSSLGGGFAVFLIGMRINRPWKVHKWWPAAMAMPKMIKELEEKPELGMLGGEFWAGRTAILVQYWRSSDHLYAHAKNRDSEHLPAWQAFNRAVETSGDVGMWHETFLVSAGGYENIYVNMPTFGLGRAGSLSSATGGVQSAEARPRARPREA